MNKRWVEANWQRQHDSITDADEVLDDCKKPAHLQVFDDLVAKQTNLYSRFFLDSNLNKCFLPQKHRPVPRAQTLLQLLVPFMYRPSVGAPPVRVKCFDLLDSDREVFMAALIACSATPILSYATPTPTEHIVSAKALILTGCLALQLPAVYNALIADTEPIPCKFNDPDVVDDGNTKFYDDYLLEFTPASSPNLTSLWKRMVSDLSVDPSESKSRAREEKKERNKKQRNDPTSGLVAPAAAEPLKYKPPMPKKQRSTGSPPSVAPPRAEAAASRQQKPKQMKRTAAPSDLESSIDAFANKPPPPSVAPGDDAPPSQQRGSDDVSATQRDVSEEEPPAKKVQHQSMSPCVIY